jgi:hypothetical protein
MVTFQALQRAGTRVASALLAGALSLSFLIPMPWATLGFDDPYIFVAILIIL